MLLGGGGGGWGNECVGGCGVFIWLFVLWVGGGVGGGGVFVFIYMWVGRK